MFFCVFVMILYVFFMRASTIKPMSLLILNVNMITIMITIILYYYQYYLLL